MDLERLPMVGQMSITQLWDQMIQDKKTMELIKVKEMLEQGEL